MRIRLVLAAVAVLFVGWLTVAPASAQYTGGTPPPAGPVAGPAPEVQGAETPVGVEVAGTETQAGRTVRVIEFALTGADIAQMVLIGGILVVGGAVLVRQGRRRMAPSGS